jgi:hypothetical protein
MRKRRKVFFRISVANMMLQINHREKQSEGTEATERFFCDRHSQLDSLSN